MRVHVDDRPRIESTRTSSTARCDAALGYFAFHRSSPARAASFFGELATTIRGIFVRGFLSFVVVDFAFAPAVFAPFAPFAPFAREGATRGASPSIFLK